MEYSPQVLVIDDEEPVRQAMHFLLRKYCDVTAVSNGWDGIQEAKKRDYDIAIVDIRMPGLSGLETLQQLKEASPETEVLMITAGDYYQESVKEAIKLGAADCITKPIRPEALKTQIMEVMRYRRAAQQRGMGR